MLNGLFYTNITYFDHTSFSKIVSRFTNDLNSLDSSVGLVLIDII